MLGPHSGVIEYGGELKLLPCSRLAAEVHDLGVAFNFDRHGHRQTRHHRLREGLDRLDRLRQQPRTGACIGLRATPIPCQTLQG